MNKAIVHVSAHDALPRGMEIEGEYCSDDDKNNRTRWMDVKIPKTDVTRTILVSPYVAFKEKKRKYKEKINEILMEATPQLRREDPTRTHRCDFCELAYFNRRQKLRHERIKHRGQEGVMWNRRLPK